MPSRQEDADQLQEDAEREQESGESPPSETAPPRPSPSSPTLLPDFLCEEGESEDMVGHGRTATEDGGYGAALASLETGENLPTDGVLTTSMSHRRSDGARAVDPDHGWLREGEGDGRKEDDDGGTKSPAAATARVMSPRMQELLSCYEGRDGDGDGSKGKPHGGDSLPAHPEATASASVGDDARGKTAGLSGDDVGETSAVGDDARGKTAGLSGDDVDENSAVRDEARGKTAGLSVDDVEETSAVGVEARGKTAGLSVDDVDETSAVVAAAASAAATAAAESHATKPGAQAIRPGAAPSERSTERERAWERKMRQAAAPPRPHRLTEEVEEPPPPPESPTAAQTEPPASDSVSVDDAGTSGVDHAASDAADGEEPVAVADSGVDTAPPTEPAARAISALGDDRVPSVERVDDAVGANVENEQNSGTVSPGGPEHSGGSDDRSVDDDGIPIAKPVTHDEDEDEEIDISNLDDAAVERVMLNNDTRMRILGEHIAIAVQASSHGIEDEDDNFEDQPKGLRGWVRRRWPWSIVSLLAVAALLIGGAAAAGVVLGGGDNDSGNPIAPPQDTLTPTKSPTASAELPTSPAPTMIPTLSPTQAPTTEVHKLLRTAINPILGDLNIVDGSPQDKALEWLEFSDEVEMNITEDIKKVQQRFALATFYYATGGEESWSNRMEFLTPTLDECSWNANVQGSPSIQGVLACENGWVTQLVINSNNMVGSIPPEIQAWTNMTLLQFDNNAGLTNSIPNEIINLAALEKLSVIDGDLTGTLPSVLGNLASLRELMLTDNRIKGSIPESIGNCTLLEIVLMENNQLTGPLPSTLGNLVILEELFLESNRLTGSVPAEVVNMAGLRNLWLSDNDITDGMNNFCAQGGPDFNLFYADCLGTSFPATDPQVSCDCCTICCNEDGSCLPN